MTLPRRLRDDPSAAPWLAQQLNATSTPAAMPDDARARVAAALAAPLRRGPRSLALTWQLPSALTLAASILLLAQWSLDADHERAARAPLHPEPRTEAVGASPLATQTAMAEPEASTAAQSPALAPNRQRAQPAQKHKAQRAAHAVSEPAWLLEARAVLSTDPERTLALIREHRDPRVPVSPAVVELTMRALEARGPLPKSHLPAQP